MNGSKKTLPSSLESLRSLVEPDHLKLSIRRQCELLGLARSSYYLEPARESPDNLQLMRLIDEQHLEHPHVGRKGMTLWLNLQGYNVNIKRVRRLMNLMDFEVDPNFRTTA
ncbi:MAG: transposase [Planctomycetaceae bacterium]|nr:transposase [Planctomycetaceae bacterium]